MSKHLLSLALICACLGAGMAEEKGEKGEHEKGEAKVTLDQLPAPVQAAVKTASAGGKVEEIEKHTHHGKTVYAVEIVGADGKKKEMLFDEAGKEVVKGDKEKGEHEKPEHGDK